MEVVSDANAASNPTTATDPSGNVAVTERSVLGGTATAVALSAARLTAQVYVGNAAQCLLVGGRDCLDVILVPDPFPNVDSPLATVADKVPVPLTLGGVTALLVDQVVGGGSGDDEHRGVLQAQGSDIKADRAEPTWSWARAQPPTKQEALNGLLIVKSQLSSRQVKWRSEVFQKARRFINSGPLDAPKDRSFQNRNVPRGPDGKRNARVDVQVFTGRAFV